MNGRRLTKRRLADDGTPAGTGARFGSGRPGRPLPDRRPSTSGDTHTVKSNPNGTPTRGVAPADASDAWYVLPWRRCRTRRSRTLALLALGGLSVSVSTAAVAYRSLASLSTMNDSAAYYSLPTVKEWSAGRETRRRTRRRREEPGGHGEPTPPAAGGGEEAQSGAGHSGYSEYDAQLLNYLFQLRAGAARKGNLLPSMQYDPPGRDMRAYSDLGCSVLNTMESPSNNATAASPRDRMLGLWRSNLGTVLRASQHREDPDFVLGDWTEELLRSVEPEDMLGHLPRGNEKGFMPKGAETTKDVERIVGIVIRRLLGIMRSKGAAGPDLPPPLRVAVFGGPTVEGLGCGRRTGVGRAGAAPPGTAAPSLCSFPHRLEHFLNSVLLPPSVLGQVRKTLGLAGVTSLEPIRIVEVVNLAERGRARDYSHAVVRNRQYPPSVRDGDPGGTRGYGGGTPDVVIDAHGIDDLEGSTSDTASMYEALRSQASGVPRHCPARFRRPPPVVVRATLPGDGAAWEVTNPILTAVVGDAVDAVEERESRMPSGGDGRPDPRGPSPPGEAGAFGMAGHVATTWALAFNLAYAAASHCWSVGTDPPPAVQRPLPAPPPGCDDGLTPPCLFSFLAGPGGTTARPSAIASEIVPFMVENTGWQPESDMSTGFARRAGLVGSGEGAAMTLLFRNATRPVRRLDVVTLRSTSPVWRDGAVRFVLVTGGDFSHGGEAAERSALEARETSFEVSAELVADAPGGGDVHISYHFGVDIEEAPLGTDVLLRVILSRGVRFKILGLMLCE